MRVGRVSPKCWGRWGSLFGMGAWLSLCHLAKCGRSRSNGASVITEIRRKILTRSVSPLKNTQGYWNRHWSIGSLWLPVSDP